MRAPRQASHATDLVTLYVTTTRPVKLCRLASAVRCSARRSALHGRCFQALLPQMQSASCRRVSSLLCRAFLEGGTAPPPPERPPFPPPAVRMLPAFPPKLGDDLGPEVLAVWSFLHFFSDILGLQSASVDEVLAAIALGERRCSPQMLFMTHEPGIT